MLVIGLSFKQGQGARPELASYADISSLASFTLVMIAVKASMQA